MSTTRDRALHINVNPARSSQLEMKDPSANGQNEDYDGKLAAAQHQLEILHSKRQELERQKIELEELNQLKQDFLDGQLEITEKLSNTISSIEREVFEMRQEIDDMDKTKTSFAKHLQRISSINPEAWPKESLKTELSRAISHVDLAEDEYEQAAAYFSGERHRGLFGLGRRGGQNNRGDFQDHLRNGLAFNLPIVILGALALLVYLIK